MLTTAVLILLLVITCLGLGAFGYYHYSRSERERLKRSLRSHAEKAEQLSQNYDKYRRKYLDLDDRFQEVQNMEQTYRVAYQEWKAKFEDLEGRSTRSADMDMNTIDEKEEAVLHSHWKSRAQKAESQLIEMTKRIAALEEQNQDLAERIVDLDAKEQQLNEVKKSFSKIYRQLEGELGNQVKPSDHPGVFNLERD